MSSVDHGPHDPATFVRDPGCNMRKDPCFYKYEEALQCLDKNNYQHDLCAEAFASFKECRANFGTQGPSAIAAGIEQDPIFGFVIKLYKNWTESRQQALQAQQAAAAAAAAEEEDRPWRRRRLEQHHHQQQQQEQQQPEQQR